MLVVIANNLTCYLNSPQVNLVCAFSLVAASSRRVLLAPLPTIPAEALVSTHWDRPTAVPLSHHRPRCPLWPASPAAHPPPLGHAAKKRQETCFFIDSSAKKRSAPACEDKQHKKF